MAVFTNLFTNPQPAIAGLWSQAFGTGGNASNVLITNAAGPAGNLGRRLTWTTSATGTGGGHAWSIGTNTAATAGATYSIGVYLHCSKAQTIDPRIQWADSGGTVITTDTGPAVTLTANTWTEVKWEGAVAPANTAFIRCQAYATNVASALWVVGDVLTVQAGTIAQSATLPQPFHGAMTDDATHDYAWTGTADASTSTLTVPDPPAGPAVPTGLTATPFSSTQINLSWNAASGATGYDIERDGVQIVTGQAGTTYSDTGRTPSTLYSYRVRSTN